MNKNFDKIKYHQPLSNAYSTKLIPSPYINKFNQYQTSNKNIFGKKRNTFTINNMQKNEIFDNVNKINSSIKKKQLKRIQTENNLRSPYINAQRKSIYNLHENSNNTLSRKRELYRNIKFKDKSKTTELKHLCINTNEISKKIQNKLEGRKIYKRINNNLNPKLFTYNFNNINSSTKKILLESKNKSLNLNQNNYINFNKRISTNNLLNNNNNEFNSTMTNRTIDFKKFDNNNKISNIKNENQMYNKDKNLTITPNRNEKFNRSLRFYSEYVNMRKLNKVISQSTNTELKNKSLRNVFNFEYGIGRLKKKQNINLKYNNNFNKNNNFTDLNYLSERKSNYNKIFGDNEIDDKEIDKIVDDLNLSFFANKNNNTVTKSNKDDSDDSLSEIADDIVKHFAETENEELNKQETVPSSSNPEIDGVTTSTYEIPYGYNNKYQSPKKIIYKSKPSSKHATIVNNFFISSSGSSKKNNAIDKHINAFKHKEYININKKKIQFPTMITQTYKSPNILREEKNKANKLFSENIKSKQMQNNKLFKSQNNNTNILVDLKSIYNTSSNTNTPNSNIKSDTNFNNNNKNNYNGNHQLKNNNSNINIGKIIKNGNSQNASNQIKQFNNNNLECETINDKLKAQNIKDNNFGKLYKINTSKYNTKKNSKITESTLKELLSSNKNSINNNNININFENNLYKIYNKQNNNNNDFNKKLLIPKSNPTQDINNYSTNNNYNINISNNNTENKNNMIYDSNDKTQNNKNNSFINNNSQRNKKNNNNINNKNNTNISIKNKNHISFNLNNNILIEFNKDNFITESKITNKNGEIIKYKPRDMNSYKNKLKVANPKPIIKTFIREDIKINQGYTLVENLPERHILPELYDEFEEDDIKSLEKSLEKSIDKNLH